MIYALTAIVAAVIALAFAGVAAFLVVRRPPGTERMVEIYEAIKEGARAYMNRQYRTLLTYQTPTSTSDPISIKKPLKGR